MHRWFDVCKLPSTASNNGRTNTNTVAEHKLGKHIVLCSLRQWLELGYKPLHLVRWSAWNGWRAWAGRQRSRQRLGSSSALQLWNHGRISSAFRSLLAQRRSALDKIVRRKSVAVSRSQCDID